MSGVFLHQQSIGLVVLVNYDHPRGRKRFSYAHEYAHALLDRKRSVNVTSKQNASELIEKRANAFAASLLVPKRGVETFLNGIKKGGTSRRNFHVYDVATGEGLETERRSLASEQEITYQDAALLGAHYGVSYHVAVYRLGDLNYVNRDQIKSLIDQSDEADAYLDCIGRKEGVSGGPAVQDRELAAQIIPLALEAYRREEISKGKLLELGKLLRVETRKLTALM
jgi:Zn-dependent peptidase ImmA (M78 family)